MLLFVADHKVCDFFCVWTWFVMLLLFLTECVMVLCFDLVSDIVVWSCSQRCDLFCHIIICCC